MRVDVSGVSWGPPAQPVLRDVSFSAAPGGFLGIIGPNGSGKTSLLRCIYRRNRPRRGTVHVGGHDIWRRAPAWCAQRIAAVLQEFPAGFSLTVRDVVAMGRIPFAGRFGRSNRRDRHAIAAAIARLDLAAIMDREFASLSGGEKQRTLIARALAQEPRVLLLDEPTNHLDIRHQLDALGLVRDLGVTAIAAIHDLNLAAAYCERVVLMNKGRIIAEGAATEVLSADVVGAVFGVRILADAHPETGRLRLAFSPADPAPVQTTAAIDGDMP